MFGEFFKKYKDKFSELKGKNKKITEYLIILLIVGIVIIIGCNIFSGDSSKEVKNEQIEAPKVTQQKSYDADPNYKLEQRLAKILSEISGVGRVSVLITYESGPESILAMQGKTNRSDVNEKDSGGGERRTVETEQESTIIMDDEENGIKKPVVVKQEASEILGVVITAEGGGNVSVKTNIISAVKAATGVSANRIQVFRSR